MSTSDVTSRPSTTSRRVASNALSNLGVVATDMVAAFLLVPYMMGELGMSTYGVWTITMAVFAYSMLLQCGLNSAVSYHIPRLLGGDNQDGINRVVSTAVVFYACGAVVMLLATVLLAVFFPIWFNIEPEHARVSRLLASVLGGYFVLLLPLSAFQAVLSGMQRYIPMNAVRMSSRVVRAGLIVLLLWRGYGLVALGMAHASARVFESLMMPLLAFRTLPGLRIRPSYASVSTLRSMLGYGVNTLIWATADALFTRAGFLIIGLFVTTTHAALFDPPMLLVVAMTSIGQSLSAVAKPAATALYAEDRMASVRSLSRRGSRYVTMFILPIAVLLIAFGGRFMAAWTGKQELRGMGGILTLLLVFQFFVVGQQVSGLVLIGLGRHRPFGVATLGAGVTGVLLGCILTGVFKLELWGVAIGYAASAGVLGILFLPWYVAKTLEISVTRHLMSVFGRPLGLAVPLFVVAVLVRRWFDPTSLWEIGVVCASLTVVLCVAYWFLCLEGFERARLAGAIGGWTRRHAVHAERRRP